MAINLKTTELTENTTRHFNDLLAMVDDPAGTPLSQKMKFLNLTGLIVNAQTGTTYTYLTGDYGKLVTHTNAASIAGTLPQAGATFPANWFMLVQNRGAGVLTITPTTSTIDGAATLVLNQNEGAIVVSDGTNYFTLRGKQAGGSAPGGAAGGDLAGTYPNPTINPDASALSPAFEVLTDGATITWALASDRVRNATVTLGGNRTLAITGAVDGCTGVLIVRQDGTGSRTLTLPAGSKVVGSGAGAIALSTAASAIDIISFYYDGTNYFWTYGKSFT